MAAAAAATAEHPAVCNYAIDRRPVHNRSAVSRPLADQRQSPVGAQTTNGSVCFCCCSKQAVFNAIFGTKACPTSLQFVVNTRSKDVCQFYFNCVTKTTNAQVENVLCDIVVMLPSLVNKALCVASAADIPSHRTDTLSIFLC